MKINRIEICGYRRFDNQTIRLESDTTILAGANNSGKTSIIELLHSIVGKSAKSPSIDDFCAEKRFCWEKCLIESAIAGDEAYSKYIAQDAQPAIEVKIEVGYTPGKDDIRQFADYLMDLDSEKHSFYFRYRYAPTQEALAKNFSLLFTQIRTVADEQDWSSPLGDESVRVVAFRNLQAEIDAAFAESCTASYEFADETFANVISMEQAQFRDLFNFRSIKAARSLADTTEDKTGGLSNRLVQVAKEDAKWEEQVKGFPAKVIEAINTTGIRKLTAEGAIQSLNTVVDSISKTSGASQDELFLDFQIPEGDAVQLIARAMRTRYATDGVFLGEASQGLGYSNLIYLHLEVESFLRSAKSPENRLLVNLLVLEEPESHMHPQMQNAFIKHLLKRVKDDEAFQCLITSHSSEVVRCSKIERLRVLKVAEGVGRVVDLRKFHDSQVKDASAEHRRLYSFLYSINFADVLFADKIVMYEGDTERMYIQAIVATRGDVESLRAQYVSYVQVGGAFAHVYLPLLVDTLGIKTVVITDIDYSKAVEAKAFTDLQDENSSNSTLNELFAREDDSAPTVGELLTFIDQQLGVAEVQSQMLAVAFQGEQEGYGRTLEEAILAHMLKIPVWQNLNSEEWQKKKLELGLRFSIPRLKEATIREVVASTSSNKTDFMYSLLLKDGFEDDVPAYLLSALRWLAK